MAHECVDRVPIFAGLAPDEREAVASKARVRRLTRGETLYGPSDARASLAVLHTGRLRVSRVQPDGREQLWETVEPGEVVGELETLTGRRPEHLVTALSDAEMCTFAASDLSAFIAAYPSVALRVTTSLARRLLDASDRAIARSASAVESRLASYLLDLPGEGDAVTLPLSKADIASLLGTTPETLSRRLRTMSSTGLIEVQGRRILILDAVRLAALADGEALDDF